MGFMGQCCRSCEKSNGFPQITLCCQGLKPTSLHRRTSMTAGEEQSSRHQTCVAHVLTLLLKLGAQSYISI